MRKLIYLSLFLFVESTGFAGGMSGGSGLPSISEILEQNALELSKIEAHPYYFNQIDKILKSGEPSVLITLQDKTYEFKRFIHNRIVNAEETLELIPAQ